MNQFSLNVLQPAMQGQIAGISLDEKKKRRLYELGLLPGSSITCVCTAPSGSPRAFWINGALIALRAADCVQISVTPYV